MRTRPAAHSRVWQPPTGNLTRQCPNSSSRSSSSRCSPCSTCSCSGSCGPCGPRSRRATTPAAPERQGRRRGRGVPPSEPPPGAVAPAAAGGRQATKQAKRSAKAAKAAGTELVVVEPPEAAGARFAVPDEATVGRGGGCQITVDDTFASQLHARVFRSEGRLHVEDLGSTNGTFLNGERVGGPVPCAPGTASRSAAPCWSCDDLLPLGRGRPRRPGPPGQPGPHPGHRRPLRRGRRHGRAPRRRGRLRGRHRDAARALHRTAPPTTSSTRSARPTSAWSPWPSENPDMRGMGTTISAPGPGRAGRPRGPGGGQRGRLADLPAASRERGARAGHRGPQPGRDAPAPGPDHRRGGRRPPAAQHPDPGAGHRPGRADRLVGARARQGRPLPAVLRRPVQRGRRPPIASVLRRLADPEEAAAELVRLANEGGGRDNISVVVVDVVDADTDVGRAPARVVGHRLRRGPRRRSRRGHPGPPRRGPPPSDGEGDGADAGRHERPGAAQPPHVAASGCSWWRWSWWWAPRSSAWTTPCRTPTTWASTARRSSSTRAGPVACSGSSPRWWSAPASQVDEVPDSWANDLPDGIDASLAPRGRGPGRRHRGGHEPAHDRATSDDGHLRRRRRRRPGRRARRGADHHEPAGRRGAPTTGARARTLSARAPRTPSWGCWSWSAPSPVAPTCWPASAPMPSCPSTSARSCSWSSGLLLFANLVMRRVAPEADPILLPMAGLLNGLGYVMIARIDESLAAKQAGWTARRHRRLRRHAVVRSAQPRPGHLPVDLRPDRHGPAAAAAGPRDRPGGLRLPDLGPHRAGQLPARRVRQDRPGRVLRRLPGREARAAGHGLLGRRAAAHPRPQAPGPGAAGLGRLAGRDGLAEGPGLVAAVLRPVHGHAVGGHRSGPRTWSSGTALFAAGATFAFRAVRPRAATRRHLARPVEGPQGRRLPDRRVGVRHGRRAARPAPGPACRGAVIIPAAETDFIFAVIAEELGLVGATAVLWRSCSSSARGLRIAERADDAFDKLLAAGLIGAHRRPGVHHHRRRHPAAAADRRHPAVRLLRRLVAGGQLRALALLVRISDETNRRALVAAADADGGPA